MSDEQQLLQTLIEEQKNTNRLLAAAEHRARREEANRARAEIAKREGVEPSQVILGDTMYSIVRRRQEDNAE